MNSDKLIHLDPAVEAQLLRHARASIEGHLRGEKSASRGEAWPADLPKCGAFVTLKKRGRLRGCVGIFSTTEPLPETIANMAVAAVEDSRFATMPLNVDDLGDLRIEISLLSALQRVNDPLDFELGKHGIYVKQGNSVGCFLPEVATEQDWDKETFLSECCAHKAGMEGDAWRGKDVEVFVFTVRKIVG